MAKTRPPVPQLPIIMLIQGPNACYAEEMRAPNVTFLPHGFDLLVFIDPNYKPLPELKAYPPAATPVTVYDFYNALGYTVYQYPAPIPYRPPGAMY